MTPNPVTAGGQPLELYNGNNSVTPNVHGTVSALRSARSQLFRRVSGARNNPNPLAFLHPATAADLRSALLRYHVTLNGCGVVPLGSTVTLSRSKIGAVLSGVRTCHSRWCPVCAAKIEAKEAWETRDALMHLHDTGQLQGCSLWHFTPTMRHSREDDQRQNWETFNKALTALTTSRLWRRHVIGHILKLEIEGDLQRSGLHPHAHIVLIFREDSGADAHTFAEQLQNAFLKSLEGLGSSAVWGDVMFSEWFKPVTDAVDFPRYLAKKSFRRRWNIIHEVCSSQAKNEGFWKRNPEDLALCYAYTEGVRLLRAGGIFREAKAHVRQVHATREPVILRPLVTIDAGAWSARPDLREPLQQLAEDFHFPAARFTALVIELFQLDPEPARQLLRGLWPGEADEENIA